MSKFIESNVRKLNKLKQDRINASSKITQATKNRLNQIVTLYKDRKIANVATAENFIKNLTSANKRTAEKARDKYNETIKDLKKSKPLNERIAENKGKDTYLVNFQLYTTRKSRNTIKPAFKKFGEQFYIEKFDIRQATVKTKEFKKEWIKKVIFRFIDEEGFKTKVLHKVDKEFDELMDILRKDKDFDNFVKDLMQHYDNLFDAIKIQQVEKISKSGEKFDIMKEDLTDGILHSSMYHRYIYTHVNSNLTNLKHAIENNTHVDNQCWFNALIDFYHDTLMDGNKRKQLTREKIIEITGKEDFYSKGASIEDMDKVFKEFKIPARIFDSFNNLIYKHEPEHNKRRIKPFYAIVKNSHIYTMNNDLKSIEQKQNLEEQKYIVKASTEYHLNEKEEPPEYKMFNDTYELLKMVSDDKEPITYYLVPEHNNLTRIFFELLNSRYEPQIKFQAGIITEVKLKLKKTTFIIKTQNLIKGSSDGCIAVDDEKTYNNMNEAMFNFNKALFNPLHKSFYNQVDLKIYKEAKTIPPTGLLKPREYIPKEVTEIDITKAYTSRLINIDKIPVFNQFDIWRPYTDDMDYNKMSDYVLYFVEDCKRTRPNFTVFLNLFNKKYNLIYGKYLKQVEVNDLKILYYKTPSFIHDVNYNELVQELWGKSISEHEELDKLIKKLIVNVNIGLLEKTENTSQKSTVFKNLKEASNFQLKHGGKIHKIEEVECHHDIMFTGDKEDENIYSKMYDEPSGTDYYLVNLSDSVMLNNGYIYIKELLLQDHNFKMLQDYNKLEKNFVSVMSVKTDAFVIRSRDVDKAREILEMKTGIGEWRANKEGEDIILPPEEYKPKPNELNKVPIYKNVAIEIKDEYDTKNIIANVINAKHVMIRAKYAGSGKSYICEKMADMGMSVLFVCPTNKLVQKYGREAITVNKFFSIAVGDEKLEKFDYSGYDVIVFDEIYFNGLRVLNRIREFVETNQDKIIVATGDGKQLKPVSELTNLQEHEEYADNCVDKIFKYNIYLKVCKRLRKEEDRKKLENIYIDIFENNIKAKDLVKKYFKYTSDINLNSNNVAYLNDTCREVANEIRKMQNRKGEYEVGEIMICREYLKSKTYKFQVNFKYKILNIIENVVVLEDEHTKIIQQLPLDMLRKHFIFNYCFTCHSVQGSSIEGGITIFDYNHCLVDKNWLYSAITRSTDLNNVSFYKYDNDDDNDFNKNCIYNYLKRKVEGYKEQDRNAKRKIDHKNYITPEWLLNRLNGRCELCNVEFYIKSINGNIRTNLTAQRKFNDQTHTISNCIAYCKKCNCQMSDKEKW